MYRGTIREFTGPRNGNSPPTHPSSLPPSTPTPTTSTLETHELRLPPNLTTATSHLPPPQTRSRSPGNRVDLLPSRLKKPTPTTTSQPSLLLSLSTLSLDTSSSRFYPSPTRPIDLQRRGTTARRLPPNLLAGALSIPTLSNSTTLLLLLPNSSKDGVPRGSSLLPLLLARRRRR